jgi:hypothetical protein
MHNFRRQKEELVVVEWPLHAANTASSGVRDGGIKIPGGITEFVR